MSDYETELRKRFNLPEEGKLCDKCKERFLDRMVIDEVLERNAIAQTFLGIDATAEDRLAAYSMARQAKIAISEVSPKIAEECFPEIDLKELPPAAYLGEKL